MKNLLLATLLVTAVVASAVYLLPLVSVLVSYALIAAAVAVQESKIWKD